MNAAWLVLGMAVLGCVVACGETPVMQSTAVAGAGAGPVAVASAAPIDTAWTPKLDSPESEFTESERTRDPFRSFASKFADEGKTRVHSQRDVVLGQYSLDELKLIGIVTRAEPARAMLVDPTGKGHVIQRGQFVGRADVVQVMGQSATYEINWRVDRIRDGDVVLIREDPANPDVPSATRVIPLRPEGSGVIDSK
jgi:type IV pilus assembly protein PilP